MTPQEQQQQAVAIMQQLQQQNAFAPPHQAAGEAFSPQAPGGVTYAWRGGPSPGAAAPQPGGAKELHFDDPIQFVSAPPPSGPGAGGGASAAAGDVEEEGEEPSANASAAQTTQQPTLLLPSQAL